MSERLPLPLPRTRTYRRRWMLHCCLFDMDCRRWKCPPRITICTPWKAMGVALTPSGKFVVGKGETRWWLTWR